MINEKKMIEEIADFKRCQKSENCDYLAGYISALSAVEGMIEEQPKVNEWIPCKRELPKTLGVYQVKRVIYEGCFKDYIVTCAYFDGQNTWHNDNRVNHGREYLKGIVAWMPLAEP